MKAGRTVRPNPVAADAMAVLELLTDDAPPKDLLALRTRASGTIEKSSRLRQAITEAA